MLASVLGRGVTLKLDVRERARVELDVAQFDMAVINLATNAHEAMDAEGQLTVRVRQEIRSLGSELLAEPKPVVTVALTDLGVGMPPDTLGRIFEPFFTTKGHGGSGLGLSQVYGFI